jgi:hypothetical protein
LSLCSWTKIRSLFRGSPKYRDACLHVFDLLWLDGVDLRPLTFLERKNRLRQLVRGRTGFLYAEHVPTTGKDLYQVICREDVEGIVAKHKLAPYVTSPATWFKVLNPDYTQKRGGREMFEGFRERTALSSEPATFNKVTYQDLTLLHQKRLTSRQDELSSR